MQFLFRDAKIKNREKKKKEGKAKNLAKLHILGHH